MTRIVATFATTEPLSNTATARSRSFLTGSGYSKKSPAPTPQHCTGIIHKKEKKDSHSTWTWFHVWAKFK